MPAQPSRGTQAKADAARKAAAVTKRLYGPNGTRRGKHADRAMTIADVVRRIEERRDANMAAAADDQDRLLDRSAGQC